MNSSLDFFFEKILKEMALREKTKVNYRSAFNKNISPVIGTLNLTDINKSHIFEILSPLPPQSRYQNYMVLKMICREALYRELLVDNPMTGIPTPKVRVEPGKFLRWEELKEMNLARQTERIHFLALHGLRWGEAAALEPTDIKDGFIHINRSIHGKTKSLAGVRKVPLLADYVPFPRNQRAIANALRPHGVTVHSLRKTYAYILKTSGVHVTTAARLMGHANPLVTLKIYTLVLDDEIEGSRGLIMNTLSNNVNK